MSALFTIVLAALGAFLTLYVLYQTLLFAVNACVPDPPDFTPTRYRRFNVIVPAHNEEMYLPRLLTTLLTDDYPHDRFRVTVVADNCTDATVAVSEPFDVDVLKRDDATQRGKGFAIRWAIERIGLNRFDAIVVIDGDSVVAPGFLRQLNLQLERGDRVIQCYNGVANPGESWFTRVMDVSRTIGNDIVHPAKRKLGLSSHLMGNGMCFDVSVLTSQAWEAFSVGEDWEYYARLVSGGTYVGYSRKARVYHQESVNLRQASSQRIRWSSGRFQVLRQSGVRLLLQGLRKRDLRCLDAALPLVFPNPSLAINLTHIGLGAALVLGWTTAAWGLSVWFAALAVSQLALFIVGVFHTADKGASAASLFLAPLFLAWKMGIDILSLCGVGKDEWKRTQRRPS